MKTLHIYVKWAIQQYYTKLRPNTNRKNKISSILFKDYKFISKQSNADYFYRYTLWYCTINRHTYVQHHKSISPFRDCLARGSKVKFFEGYRAGFLFLVCATLCNPSRKNSETALTEETPLYCESGCIPGTWTADLLDRKQTVDPLDQWDWVLEWIAGPPQVPPPPQQLDQGTDRSQRCEEEEEDLQGVEWNRGRQCVITAGFSHHRHNA